MRLPTSTERTNRPAQIREICSTAAVLVFDDTARTRMSRVGSSPSRPTARTRSSRRSLSDNTTSSSAGSPSRSVSDDPERAAATRRVWRRRSSSTESRERSVPSRSSHTPGSSGPQAGGRRSPRGFPSASQPITVPDAQPAPTEHSASTAAARTMVSALAADSPSSSK